MTDCRLNLNFTHIESGNRCYHSRDFTFWIRTRWELRSSSWHFAAHI